MREDIKSELEAVSKMMQSHRPDQPFTELEKALGLWSFSYWLRLAQTADKTAARRDYFAAPNDSARFAALSFVDNNLDDPDVISIIREKRPKFSPSQEFEWGTQKASHSEWKSCITRAIVMICRGLSYRYTGILGHKSDVLRDTSWEDLRSGGVESANEAVGSTVFS